MFCYVITRNFEVRRSASWDDGVQTLRDLGWKEVVNSDYLILLNPQASGDALFRVFTKTLLA